MGLLIDCLLLETLGGFALTLLSVGYVAGRYRETVGRPTRGAVALLGGALTLLGALVIAAIQIGTGIDANVSVLVLRDAVIKSLIGAALAIPVLLLVRLVVRSALVDERRGARRQRQPEPPKRGPWSRRSLMYRRTPEVEPERRTSPLALRISILTGLAIAIFSVLFLRLWYVQVLSGDKYRTQANDNRIREIRVQAPRGDILDRNGKVMVANRTELAVEVSPQDLPDPGRTRVAGAASALHRHRDDHGGDPQGAQSPEPGRAGRPGDPEEGPRRRQGLLPAREPVELPGRERASACSLASTRTGTSAPTCSATSAR